MIQRNVHRVARLAQSLRAFGRQPTGEHVPVGWNVVIEDTMVLVRKALAADDIRIELALAAELPAVAGDASALQEVLLNLITNAREAMDRGGCIRIETALVPGPPRRIRVTVSDSGPGIAPEHLPRIFDPFYTTKAEGTGLGLSVTYGIVQNHEGTIEVDSEPPRGTTFVLTFPALRAEPA